MPYTTDRRTERRVYEIHAHYPSCFWHNVSQKHSTGNSYCPRIGTFHLLERRHRCWVCALVRTSCLEIINAESMHFNVPRAEEDDIESMHCNVPPSWRVSVLCEAMWADQDEKMHNGLNLASAHPHPHLFADSNHTPAIYTCTAQRSLRCKMLWQPSFSSSSSSKP